ncbi:MAG: hypothetical protein ABI550_03165, partial [Ignavibacteriaceae bacterium]
NAYGLGASINYGIIFSAGITYKDIYSQLGSLQINSTDKGSTKANAIDYGFLITVPVIKLIDENYCFDFFNNSKIVPSFNYNLGYSRLNIGKEIYYVDPAQKDPLPLTARLGQTFNFGFNFQNNEISINLLNYDLILEADDILIDGRSNNEVSYQGFLGDIDFGKHLIQLKGDNKVVVHKGHAISFVETVTLLKGSFHGRGYMDIRQTDGLMLSTNGLFKWVSSQINNGPLKFITDHLELRYISSSIFNNSDIETNFSGLSVSFVNYSFN